MNKFKILIIICLIHANAYSNLYDTLPKNSKCETFFMLHTGKFMTWRENNSTNYVGTNELLSLMYSDMIDNFKKLKQENMALKNQIIRLESKIDLLIAKFNADQPPAYGN